MTSAGRRPATGRSFVTMMVLAALATSFATYLGMRGLFKRRVPNRLPSAGAVSGAGRGPGPADPRLQPGKRP